MSRTVWVAPVVALAALFSLWSASGRGGDKTPSWKQFLPPKVYEDLSHRSLERIAKADSLKTLHAEALLLAGYATSTRATPPAGLPQPESALVLAELASKEDSANAARKLAKILAASKEDTKASGAASQNWTNAIGDLADLMELFRGKAKGGEGLPAELQYNAKLKSQNGVEALINALADKKLTAANTAKVAPELELLGYRVATIGALTLQAGPTAKKAEGRKLWDEQASTMRDAAVELAQAAHAKDSAAILEASKRLENSCVECHSKFKS